METKRQYYPIGSQPFPEIREKGITYVDKTDMIYEMVSDLSTNYFFLSRPRRFGKTLLVTTLKAYFNGRKELFDGLAIGELEKEWKKYPVLHFDMSHGRNMDEARLRRYLSNQITTNEELNGMRVSKGDENVRLTNLIRRLYEKTGQKVVVLVDEYDSPMLEVMHDDEELPKVRNVMRDFYSPLKGSADYLRFVFLTGITKFSQLSIFSELNNIRNISMNPKYATICGITEEEMLTQLCPGIERLAENKGLTYDEAVARLKQTYDGYHFCWPCPDIYNPYSLLNALTDSEISNYWFGTATPHYLVEMMRKFEVTAVNIGGRYATASDFDAPTEYMTSIIPLLYQSGYITIKGYDSDSDCYLLDIPNKEVRIGLMGSLLEEYVTPAFKDKGMNTAGMMRKHLVHGEIDEAFELLKKFLSTVPYTDNTDYEGHYQSMLAAILLLIATKEIDVEVHTSKGRIDLVMKFAKALYLFELELDGSAKEALEQIDIKKYDERFALYELPVVKVGINFSTETRTLTDWVIERPPKAAILRQG